MTPYISQQCARSLLNSLFLASGAQLEHGSNSTLNTARYCLTKLNRLAPTLFRITSKKRATPQGKTNRIFCHAVEYTAVVVGNDRCIIFYQGLMFIPNCGSLPASEVLNLRRQRSYNQAWRTVLTMWAYPQMQSAVVQVY